jgi:hypothetical protein
MRVSESCGKQKMTLKYTHTQPERHKQYLSRMIITRVIHAFPHHCCYHRHFLLLDSRVLKGNKVWWCLSGNYYGLRRKRDLFMRVRDGEENWNVQLQSVLIWVVVTEDNTQMHHSLMSSQEERNKKRNKREGSLTRSSTRNSRRRRTW